MKNPRATIAVRSMTALSLTLASGGVASASELYFSENTQDAVYAINADGTGQRLVRDLDSSVFGERAYTIGGLDVFDATLYICETTLDRIFTSNINGVSNQATFINIDAAFGNADYSPRDVKADADYVFWNDSNTHMIYRVNRDGANPLAIVSLPTNAPPQGIELWGENLFWSDPANHAIYRADRDGNNAAPLIDLGGPGHTPGWLATNGQWLFWCDIDTNAIYRANIDGSDAAPIVDMTGRFELANDVPVGLVTDGARLYWTGTFDDRIFSCNLDGSHLASPLLTPSFPGSVNINRLAVEFIPTPGPLPLAATAGLALIRRRRPHHTPAPR